MNNFFLYSLCGIGASMALSCSKGDITDEERPNVILIYTDDVGYGDVAVYGGKIPTPNIDRIAQEGIRFTNAYATSATSTPSRFSLLTGEYAWREEGRGVVQGDAPSLISTDRDTWPKMMQRAGYATSVVGKWHLGLGGEDGPDWNGKIFPGPLETGFDYSYIIPATNDRVPTVYVKNHYVENLDEDDPIKVSFDFNKGPIGDRPTGIDNPEKLKMMWSHGHNHTITNGISRIGYMKGGESALWRDEDIADNLVDKSVDFITNHKDEPFFLYFSTIDIHVPRIVHERFQGITSYGPRGDMMVQLDWSVGALLDVLEKYGLRDNTIVIFTSDNGPVLDDGYVDYAREMLGEHKPWGDFRGGKYSAFEAGTKVPFLVSWPNGIEKNRVNNALFSQVDFFASFASFLDEEYSVDDAIDSKNHWDALMGIDLYGRYSLVQHAIRDELSYIRNDGFKFIPSNDGPEIVPWGTHIETGFSKKDQLYDLKSDPGETNNISKRYPDLLDELRMELEDKLK
ncbi:arylsulfatase [Marinilabiliaceae bacterium ANBcel2]|nr:arylsulfatase [Marinilabiliaceae bacterium ANBcel2]